MNNRDIETLIEWARATTLTDHIIDLTVVVAISSIPLALLCLF